MRALINSRQIRALRKVADAGLFDVATIYEPPDRATAARTTRGDIDDAFPTNWTKTEGVACRVNLPKRRAYVQQGAGQPKVFSEATITFKPAVAVSSKARIKITASRFNPLLVGQIYDAIDAPQESTQVSRVVQVKQA